MGMIIGVDEVGRGPLAGPVVACACVLPTGFTAPWLASITDSKKLTAKKREQLAALLQAAVPYAVAAASVAEIDSLNILQASLLAMGRAVAALQAKLPEPVTEVRVDGNQKIPGLLLPQITMVGGDATDKAIGAASIIAKVYRDALMQTLHEAYPHYGWGSNAGYGSAVHMVALQTHGATPHHRTSFAPVRAVLVKQVAHAA